MNKKNSNIVIAVVVLCLIVGFTAAGVKIFSKRINDNKKISSETVDSSSELQSDTSSNTSDSLSSDEKKGADTSNGTAAVSSAPTSSVSASSAPVSSSAPSVTSVPSFPDIPEGSFAQTLFIGDSRTVGICNYGGIKDADFFATVGMSIYKLNKEKATVNGLGSVTLEQALNAKQYKRIYIMLGVNEIGYNIDQTVNKYNEAIKWIRERQPDAAVIIEANLRVSKVRSSKGDTINNKRIDELNGKLAKLADGAAVYYIDVNPVFDDGSGNLGASYTNDGVHILAKYYLEWAKWLAQNTVIN